MERDAIVNKNFQVGDMVRPTAHLRDVEGEVGLVLAIEETNDGVRVDLVVEIADVCWSDGTRCWNWVYNLKRLKDD